MPMRENFSINIDKIPKELKLILEILSIEDLESIQRNFKECSESTDWDLFMELAIHHRVFPVLINKIKKSNLTIIPQNVIQEMQQIYTMNTFKMLQFTGEMDLVSQLFIQNKIRLIFLKGPILGADLYGDISLRSSADLDFLISINDIEQAEELLTKQGYIKDDYIQTVLNDWKWRHHHVTYFHPQKEIKLEIHWRLNPGPGKEPSFNELWGRKRVSSLTNTPIYYLGKEDLFLFLVSHGARHGWSRLRWLLDIKQLLKQQIDWAELTKLLKEFQYHRIGEQSLVLVSQLLKEPISIEMKKLVTGNSSTRLAQEAIFYLERMVNLHNEPLPEDISIYHKRHLFFLMSTKQKLLFIMSFLYPYPEDAKTLPLPKKLHFLYFPLRPFLWVWRKTRTHAIT
jgi:hypothetical protein